MWSMWVIIPATILASGSGTSVGISAFIVVALGTIAEARLVYLPYKRLSSELKSHGYTIN